MKPGLNPAAAGSALTVLVSAVLYLGFGSAAIIPAMVFGAIATAIQVVATLLLRRAERGPFPVFIRSWAAGAGLRLIGVLLIAVAVMARRDVFPPLPTALAFLGVMIPLLFMEIRLAR
jgi:hypothetical protein